MLGFRIVPLILVLAAALLPVPALAQNEVPVSYQGRLTDGGDPANGLFDILVRLGDTEDGSGAVLSEQTFLGVEVSEGLFTLELDYPRDGQADQPRWLELNVRPAGGGSYDQLLPRQRITPAPEAGNTRAARLKPDNSVVIGGGSDFSVAPAYAVAGAPDGSIQGYLVLQSFVATESGVPVSVTGHFNTTPVGLVQVGATIRDAGGVVVAQGLANVATEVSSIGINYLDPVNGRILAGEPYILEISYLLGTGMVATDATTGYTAGDVYSGGQMLSQPDPTIDLTASVLIDRGFADVRITEAGDAQLGGGLSVEGPTQLTGGVEGGLAVEGVTQLNGGLVVGPTVGGDASVVLPEGSVNPTEMLGVPGIYIGVMGGGGDAIRTIRGVAPADGYVHAVGCATIFSNFPLSSSFGLILGGLSPVHGFGTGSLAEGSMTAYYAYPTGGGHVIGDIKLPLTVQSVYQVTAGQEFVITLSLQSPASVRNASLVGTFYPVRYDVP